MEKKSNLTRSSYQAQFLPLLEHAETEIKKLITYYVLHFKSKYELREKIRIIIKVVAKKLPLNLIDKENYIYGLYRSSERMIRDFYDDVIKMFLFTVMLLKLTQKKEYEKIKTPLDLYNRFNAKPLQTRNDIAFGSSELKITSSTKGYPNVENYPKLIREKVNTLSRTQTKSGETETTPTSLWAKAERDLRYEHQINMIEDLKSNGVQYAYTSSHPDCSKRCSHWQGKLFDLSSFNSELSGHRMAKKLDGKTVYCFNEVVNQVDKYGYKNNIIVGFNCRHKLIPYTKGSVPPTEFTKEELQKNREINANLRKMERDIRAIRQEAQSLVFVDKKKANQLNSYANRLFDKYKKYANDNGFAWYEWRCKV